MKQVRFIFLKFEKENELLKQFLHIRYKRFVEEMEAEQPNELLLETDRYDKYSYFILALIENRVIGGCRLIDGERIELPVKRHFFPWITIPRKSTEVSRWVMDRDCILSKREKVLVELKCNQLVGLIGHFLGFEAYYANIRSACKRLQRKIDKGLRMSIVGEANYHPGAGELIPVLFSR